MLHIVPFYNSDDENVLTVYESSYFFQNHINQAFKNFDFTAYDHYVFVGDDLILNPELNEDNIIEKLQLTKNAAYIKELKPLDQVHHLWLDKFKVTSAFANPGFDYMSQLPPLVQQLERFKKQGISFKKQTLRNLIHWKEKFSVLQLARYKNLPLSITKLIRGYQPPIPIVTSYADFFVVPQVAMKSFTHLCGVYGALNLWVEAAIPTALLLACDEIVTEGPHLRWTGTEIWGKKNKLAFESDIKTNKDLDNKFQPFQLYIHPVKLSRVTVV